MAQELGSAAFIDPAPFCPADWAEGSKVLFGCFCEDLKKPMKRICFKPERHFLSVHSTRSGKGVSFILPNLLHYRGSCLVIDPKGENAWQTFNYRRDVLKQKVHIVDPWDTVKKRYADISRLNLPAPPPTSFNPLALVSPESPHYSEDLAYIADALIINQGTDPHWDNSARELVSGLMAYLLEVMPKAATFETLRVLLSKPQKEIAGLAQEAQSLGFESLARRKLGRFATLTKENSSIISAALSQTAFLDSETLCNSMLGRKNIFEDFFCSQGATIYLVLPVDKLQTFGRWLRLLVSMAIRTIAAHTSRLSLPVLLMLDEFGTIGRLSAVSQAYGLMAGLNMCLWAFVQDLSQLKRDYPQDWETFVANSQLVTFGASMDQFTAEYFSRSLGNETIERRNVSTSISDASKSTSLSSSIYARALLTPDEVRRIPDNGFVMLSRFGPIEAYMMPLYNDGFFKPRAWPNPHFEEAETTWTQQKEDARRAENIARNMKRIRNFKDAVYAVGLRYFKVERTGFLWKKVQIFKNSPPGNGQRSDLKTFDSVEDFLTWVRENF